MKKIYIFLALSVWLSAGIIKTPIVSLEDNTTAIVAIDKIDVGMSGFVLHEIDSKHSIIVKKAVVDEFDEQAKKAKIHLSEFTFLDNSALPSGKWEVAVGDKVILAFGYDRGLLIAPSEEIYYTISKSVRTNWIHPDIFATLLSTNGHPTPLIEDFKEMSLATSIGLLYIYIDQKIYTIDAKTFSILHITDAKLKQDKTMLPFYSRVENIEANLWGEGSDELVEYAPHYYKLLIKNNKQNKDLEKIIKSLDKNEDLLKLYGE